MKNFLIILSLALLLVFSACGNPKAAKGPDYEKFLTLLADNGFQYTEEEQDAGSFLSVARKPVWIGEDLVSVYEYGSKGEMEQDSSYVQKDGYGIDRPDRSVQIDWAAPPHFFKKDTLIIHYAGENESLINFFRAHYGAEFAGQGYKAEESSLYTAYRDNHSLPLRKFSVPAASKKLERRQPSCVSFPCRTRQIPANSASVYPDKQYKWGKILPEDLGEGC